MGRTWVTEAKRFGEAEEQCAESGADRTPVAEDHRGQADEALATSLAFAIQAGELDREETSTESGKGATDDHAVVLVLVDVYTERIGSVGCFTAAAQPEPE